MQGTLIDEMSNKLCINADTALFMDVLYIPSPNCDARPDSNDINLLVVHGISLPPGQYGGQYIEQLFTNSLNAAEHSYFADIVDLRVSAHLLIRRDGEIIQFVPFSKRAWHAGQSSFAGRERCNDYSIGIELEGTDDDAYTDEQYQILAGVSKALMRYYPAIETSRITGHSDIAPGRKTDPGAAFDWQRFKGLISGG